MSARRPRRAEPADERADYHALTNAELTALLWAATSEHQRRHGDRRTRDVLAYLAASLPAMAMEDR